MRKIVYIKDWLHLAFLYRNAFPASERKPLSIIRKMWKKGRTDIWIFEHCGTFAGFAATINGDQHILIDYLAICASKRDQGAGTAFLHEIMAHYAPKGVFVEVEWMRPDHPGYDTAQRRKAFYLRAGMRPFETYFNFFGVDMELLGKDCHLDFDAFKDFHAACYSPWAAAHILPLSAPGGKTQDS